jgi:hypothetical protein
MTPKEAMALAIEQLNHTRIASTPGGIEQQEAAGQRTLIESNILPTTIRGATREQLTAFGFQFGQDMDDLFVECTLPPGWTKKAGEWDTHNDLLDEQGRIRAFIYYKAAFYDRQAYMSLTGRFKVDLYCKAKDDQHRLAAVTDYGKIIHELGEWGRSADTEVTDALYEQGKAWLAEHYPGWESRTAYWD